METAGRMQCPPQRSSSWLSERPSTAAQRRRHTHAHTRSAPRHTHTRYDWSPETQTQGKPGDGVWESRQERLLYLIFLSFSHFSFSLRVCNRHHYHFLTHSWGATRLALSTRLKSTSPLREETTSVIACILSKHGQLPKLNIWEGGVLRDAES